MWGRGFIGADVGGKFPRMEPVDSYFHSAGPVVVSGPIAIRSPNGGVVLVVWSGFLRSFFIVVLADDKHGGCVGI